MATISMRYCPDCNAQVEDAGGGYCLLGHPLPPSSGAGPLTELRGEIDRAFERMRSEVATAPAASTAAPPPPPPPPLVTPTPVEEPVTDRTPPPPPPRRVSPPPPPEVGPRSVFHDLGLPDTGLLQDDPIAAFAPPPRMDWGPRDSSRLVEKLPRLLRPSRAAV